MSMSFSRTAIIPVWLLVFGLFVLLGSSMTFATVAVLLMGGTALIAMLALSKGHRPTIAAMTVPGPPLATLPSANIGPGSWPNSGFRNSRQRATQR